MSFRFQVDLFQTKTIHQGTRTRHETRAMYVNFLLVILTFGSACSAGLLAQQVESRKSAAALNIECPTISVSCPDDMSPKIVTYSAHISGLEPSQKITYKWSISRGKIKSGQGTSSIAVERPDDMNGLTATVEIGGLPAACSNAASCTTVF